MVRRSFNGMKGLDGRNRLEENKYKMEGAGRLNQT
jgi:hypothetical protein